MKPKDLKQLFSAICFGTLHTLVLNAGAQIVVAGADGSDGVFAPTVSTNINLTLAPDGAWNGTNGAPGRGVYDPEKWAVVFRYSSVNIPPGVTVTFLNHRTRPPVVWLVSSNVTISGTIQLNGQDTGANDYNQSLGGPGGFRGSYSSHAGLTGKGGYGPGGGAAATDGIFAEAYGNSRNVPLIGGSGGGHNSVGPRPGGGGGGAIFIAAAGVLTVNGLIQANGASITLNGAAYDGSGGAIRLLAGQLRGAGILQAFGLASGRLGRIRLETTDYAGRLVTYPFAGVVPPDNPVLIWPMDDSPNIRVVSIGGQAAPPDPNASLNPPGGDVNLITGSSVPVVIEARNLATNATMTVRVTPTSGNPSTVNATRTSGDFTNSQWSATVNIAPNTYAAIQVRAVGP